MSEVSSRTGLYGFDFREPDQRRVSVRKSPEIKMMWQRSHEIVNLAARGYKQVEIAEILNIDPQTVSNTLNSELGKRKLADLRRSRDDEVKITCEKIRVLTNKALEVYHEVFDDESGECGLKDKMKVADTVLLELSGLRVPTRIQAHSTHTVLTAEELEGFKQRGIAAAKESGLLVEAEEVPVEVVVEADGQCSTVNSEAS